MHHSLKFSAILSVLTVTALISSSCLAQHLDTNQAQTVTIKAKRLSMQEKTTYDQEQMNLRIQQVVISAKRLSTADKLAYDKTQARQ
jgi:lipopolysaccharide export system protein LptA